MEQTTDTKTYKTRKLDQRAKRGENYIDNQKFKDALREWKVAREASTDHVVMPRYVGESIKLIAQRMATRPNFSGYSFIDDMVGDAIVICVKYADRFDPDRGTSALGYFSQCVWMSFLGRIKKEKDQNRIKREMVKFFDVETYSTQEHDAEFNINLTEFLSSIGGAEDEIIVQEIPRELSVLEQHLND